jgi:hypothetical protein
VPGGKQGHHRRQAEGEPHRPPAAGGKQWVEGKLHKPGRRLAVPPHEVEVEVEVQHSLVGMAAAGSGVSVSDSVLPRMPVPGSTLGVPTLRMGLLLDC